jgi:hypothetical protein
MFRDEVLKIICGYKLEESDKRNRTKSDHFTEKEKKRE